MKPFLSIVAVLVCFACGDATLHSAFNDTARFQIPEPVENPDTGSVCEVPSRVVAESATCIGTEIKLVGRVSSVTPHRIRSVEVLGQFRIPVNHLSLICNATFEPGSTDLYSCAVSNASIVPSWKIRVTTDCGNTYVSPLAPGIFSCPIF